MIAARRGMRARIVTAVPVFLAAGLVFAADAPVGLGGTVRDPLGNLLEDVEVIFVAAGDAGAPAAVAHTDVLGRFAVKRIEPALYRVAALKDGYLTFVGKVNTGLEHWLDLVLRPVPAEAEGFERPGSEAWPLRSGQRPLFRDTDAPAVAEPAGEALLAAAPVPARDPLQMRVDQTFALGAGTGGQASGSEGPAMHGSRTDLRLASPLGASGSLELRGGRARLRPAGPAGSSGAGLDAPARGSDFANLEMAFDTGRSSQLGMRAYYDDRDLRWSPATSVDEPGARQGQRAWGYDARWMRRLDARSSLNLRVDVREDALELSPGSAAPSAGPASRANLSQRAVSASGVYENAPTPDHRVALGFSTERLETAGATSATVAGSALDPAGLVGYTVGVEAEDTWSVSRPFALHYGLGYRHSVTARDAALVTPRLGGTWSFDPVTLRVVVTYHAVTDWGDAGPGAARFRPASPLGYDVALDVPIGEKIALGAMSSYTPIQLGVLGGDLPDRLLEFTPTFVTDGNAAVRRTRLTLSRDSLGTRTLLQLETGQAAGNLAAFMPFDGHVRQLASHDLGFDRASFGLVVLESGTQVRLDYSRVEERGPGEAPEAERVRQQALELALRQDLDRIRDLGRWSFLMALRFNALQRADGESGTTSTTPTEVASAELSAGLSVAF